MSQTVIEALKSIIGWSTGTGDEQYDNLDATDRLKCVKAHAERALSALHAKAGVSVKVKELVWKEEAPRHHHADTVVGDYSVIGVTANTNYRLYRNTDEITCPDGHYWPLEAAKAAAQQDYEGRILSALSTKLQEPVGEKYRADINNSDEDWVQVTISGDGAHNLTEQDIEAALNGTLAHQPVTAGWEKEREALMKVAWAAKEFIDDWTKGDFSLSTLAALDAQSLDDALTALSELQSDTAGWEKALEALQTIANRRSQVFTNGQSMSADEAFSIASEALAVLKTEGGK